MSRNQVFGENVLLNNAEATIYNTWPTEIINDEEEHAHYSFHRRYRVWFSVTVTSLVIGTLLLILNTGVALYCLTEYGFSTAICDIESARFPTLDEMRSITETIEPLVCVFVVISVLVFTFNPTLSGSDCCSCQVRQQLSKVRRLFTKYWFTTYLVMLFLSYLYHTIVFVLDVGVRWEGALRYAILPLGLTAWFIWLVVLNERGAMTMVVRKQNTCRYQQLRNLGNEQDDNRHNSNPPGLYKLYITLLIFAGMTNIVEFLLYTIYVTGSFATINATEKNRLLWYFDFMCMSLTAALRYSFASFYFQMAYIGEKKFKQIVDPWDRALANIRHEHTNTHATNTSV